MEGALDAARAAVRFCCPNCGAGLRASAAEKEYLPPGGLPALAELPRPDNHTANLEAFTRNARATGFFDNPQLDADGIFRRTLREAALKHDMYATFMAKPMAGEPGSAMHIHQSVVDAKTGWNIFSNEDGSPSQLFKHYIGGLQRYMPSALAIVAPYVNSYRRLVRHTAAPINIQWGMDNRTVGFRVPESGVQDRRVENRIIGTDMRWRIPGHVAHGMLHQRFHTQQHGKDRHTHGDTVVSLTEDGQTRVVVQIHAQVMRAFAAMSMFGGSILIFVPTGIFHDAASAARGCGAPTESDDFHVPLIGAAMNAVDFSVAGRTYHATFARGGATPATRRARARAPRAGARAPRADR